LTTNTSEKTKVYCSIFKQTISSTIPPQSSTILESPMEAPVKDPAQPVVATGDRHQGEAMHHGGTYLPQQILPTEVSGQSMPPLQVYVNAGMHNANGMAGLESQFQSLGMNGPSDHDHLYDLEDDDAGEPIDNDEDECEEEPVKLFVGQVRIFLGQQRVVAFIDMHAQK
jgi:hypothetical protein